MYYDLIANLDLEPLFCVHLNKFGKCLLITPGDKSEHANDLLYKENNRIQNLEVEACCVHIIMHCTVF